MSNTKMGVNFGAIGNLVKSWVLGEDRLMIPNPNDPKQFLTWPKPVSTTDPSAIDALRKQFQQAGTDFVIPDEVTEVEVVQSSKTRLVLKLPAEQTILDFEAEMDKTDYPTPPFYMCAVSAPPKSLDDKLYLDAQRIGDYTISNCAGG